jgi:hypothetical protein
MRKIKLQFLTLESLVEFQRVTITNKVFVIDTKLATLWGTFSEAQIELAKEGYLAVVLEQIQS